MKDIKIVFMGTPDFAVPIFTALAKNYNVVAVVTKPDKLVGRKQILTPTPIKKASAEFNIPILQPVRIKDEYKEVLKYQPDMIITCAYGQIIPKELLDYPKYKCINVHASLLPKLRGGAPIHHAIMDGYAKTGITIMYMDTKMDTGDIISKRETNITKDDTLGSLRDRLSEIGKDLLLETLPNIINGTINPIKQDESEATYGYNITKEDEKIDFTKTNVEIDNKVRALNPTPGAYTTINGKRMKVYDVIVSDRYYANTKPGTIVGFEKDGIRVVTGDKEIILTDIAIEGKKRCLVKDYLNGVDKEELLGVVLK